MLAKTLGKGCVSERKIRKIVSDVLGCGYYSDHNNRLVVNDESQQYVYHQENRFRFLYGLQGNVRIKAVLMGTILWFQSCVWKSRCRDSDGCGSGKSIY